MKQWGKYQEGSDPDTNSRGGAEDQFVRLFFKVKKTSVLIRVSLLSEASEMLPALHELWTTSGEIFVFSLDLDKSLIVQ